MSRARCQELILRGKEAVMFATSLFYGSGPRSAKRDLKLRGFLKKISQYHVMILDDIGYVQYSREEMEVLFALLAERYERGSVVLTRAWRSRVGRRSSRTR